MECKFSGEVIQKIMNDLFEKKWKINEKEKENTVVVGLSIIGLVAGYIFIAKSIISDNTIFFIPAGIFAFPSLIICREKYWNTLKRMLKGERTPVWFNIILSLALFVLGVVFGSE